MRLFPFTVSRWKFGKFLRGLFIAFYVRLSLLADYVPLTELVVSSQGWMPPRDTEMPGENFVNEGQSNEYAGEVSAVRAAPAKVAASIAALNGDLESARSASAGNPQAMLHPPSFLGASGSSSSKRLLKKGMILILKFLSNPPLLQSFIIRELVKFVTVKMF